jgi:hypothetical protein
MMMMMMKEEVLNIIGEENTLPMIIRIIVIVVESVAVVVVGTINEGFVIIEVRVGVEAKVPNEEERIDDDEGVKKGDIEIEEGMMMIVGNIVKSVDIGLAVDHCQEVVVRPHWHRVRPSLLETDPNEESIIVKIGTTVVVATNEGTKVDVVVVAGKKGSLPNDIGQGETGLDLFHHHLPSPLLGLMMMVAVSRGDLNHHFLRRCSIKPKSCLCKEKTALRSGLCHHQIIKHQMK